MGWVAPVAMGVGSLLGGLLSGKGKQKQTQQGSMNQTSTPTFDPAFSPMKNLLLRNITGRLGQRSSLGAGFANNRIATTNSVFDTLRQGQQNRLSAAGLSGSPVDMAGANALDISRGGAISQGLNEIPMLENEMDQGNIQAATGALSLGRGTTTTGTSTGSAEGGMNGWGQAGAGMTDLMSMLGWLYGQGAFGQGGGGGGGNGLFPAP